MKYRVYAHLGWPLIILATLFPIYQWIAMTPLSERFVSMYTSLGSIGKLAGLVALVLFCMNIILTTRLRIVEKLFGGLNKMYIAHHLSGGLALCIILLHPIAFSFQKITFSIHDAAVILLPRLSDIPVALGVIGLWIFIALMLVTFFISLPYRIWVFTHKFLGLVLLLIGLHVILISSDTSSNPVLKYYLLVILGLAAVSFIYRTLLPKFLVRRHMYKIVGVTQPSPGVARIFMFPEGAPMSYKSGQFVFVSFKGEGFSHEWHPFSISSNSRDGHLAVTVKSLGKYTDTLVKLAPGMMGMKVGVEGAYGRFNFRNFREKRQIWIAGGIGITPFLSMVKDVTPEYKVDLYYSVKSEGEMIDAQAIQQLAAGNVGSFRFIPYVADHSGFLTGEIIKATSGELDKAEILLCGPPPMMHALKDQLIKLGVRKWYIHSEEFSMS